MATLKLFIEEEPADFKLLAIHTLLEDFRLAYFLNQSLGLGLNKNPEGIKITNREADIYFSRFSFEDTRNDVFWDLIENQNELRMKQTPTGQGLFAESGSFAAQGYLLPEFKKANFLLKIDDSGQSTNMARITKEIKNLNWISTAYSIDLDHIKSKNNLIF